MVARAETQRALARSAEFEQSSKAETARADSALQLAQLLYGKANSAQANATAAKARFRATVDTADTCDSTCSHEAEIAFTADSLDNIYLRDALHASETAAYKLSIQLDSAKAVIVDLRASSVTLDRAAGLVVRAAKPSFLSRVLPKPGIGLAAGIDQTGKPHVIAGVSLGWAF